MSPYLLVTGVYVQITDAGIWIYSKPMFDNLSPGVPKGCHIFAGQKWEHDGEAHH